MRVSQDGLDTILRSAAAMLKKFEKERAGRQRADWNKGAVESGITGLGQAYCKTSARTFWGETMIVDLRDVVGRTIFWDGVFEPEVCSVAGAVLKEGGVAIDVGSEIGFQSFYFSKLVGNSGLVLVVEPSEYMYTDFLSYNLRTRTNIRFERTACWHTSHLDKMFHEFTGEYAAFSGLFDIRTSRYKEIKPNRSYSVKTKSVDLMRNEIARPLDFVKIDAESAEMAILKGMKKTLAEDAPVIIIELGDFDHLQKSGVPFGQEILEFLAEYNYTLFANDGAVWTEHNIQKHYDYCNILAIAVEPKQGPLVKTRARKAQATGA